MKQFSACAFCFIGGMVAAITFGPSPISFLLICGMCLVVAIMAATDEV